MSGLLHAAEYRVGSSWDAVSRIAIVAEKCRGKSARPLNQTTRWNGLKSTMMGRWKGNIGRVQTDLLILLLPLVDNRTDDDVGEDENEDELFWSRDCASRVGLGTLEVCYVLVH